MSNPLRDDDYNDDDDYDDDISRNLEMPILLSRSKWFLKEKSPYLLQRNIVNNNIVQ